MSRWWVWWNCASELFSWHSRRGAGPSCPGISCTASHYLLQLCCSRFLAIVKPTQDLANRCEKVGIVKVRYGGMVGLLINWLFPSLCLLYRVDPSNLPHPSMLLLFSTTMATKKHCQRHNGPEGWVLLSIKETFFGPITSSDTNFIIIISTKHQLQNLTKHQHFN